MEENQLNLANKKINSLSDEIDFYHNTISYEYDDGY